MFYHQSLWAPQHDFKQPSQAQHVNKDRDKNIISQLLYVFFRI